MHDEGLLENLFDSKTLKILRLFLDDKNRNYYLMEISKISGVPVATSFRVIKKLTSLKIVEQVNVNKFKLYKLAENENSAFLIQIIKEKPRALEEFVQGAKGLVFIEEIILHGRDEGGKANLLLIGQNIDPEPIKLLCSQIKDKYNYIITHLPLTGEQFMQMNQMNLFPKEKKSIYRRQN